ncbi:sperm microtubule inner protein 8-like [Halichondria panicea]|uniref:sperm microtubule inner protein 8-like n=1 Tax=Halichondria panicea TaxID=6063 RepID=UPI00312B73F1
MAATLGHSRWERPSSAKLAGVKFELYNPALPTLRRMSMDDVTKRLPTEHTRTSTPCNRGEFVNARTTLRKRGWSDPVNLPSKKILSKNTSSMLSSVKNLQTRTFAENWAAILSSLNNSQSIPMQREIGTQTDTLQLTITGLASRTTHPDITNSWQNRRPHNGQWSRPSTAKQMPAAMYSRYRGTRPYSANPWK